MDTASLSVIIPTFNRKETLAKTLEAYRGQTSAEEILEILVVDDGSTDGTQVVVEEYAKSLSVPIRYFRQESRGPAVARNRGIREAQGELILFGDDDILPSPTLVAEHIAWRERYSGLPLAVLGHVEWASEVHPTPFMQWLGNDGVYFQFRRLSEKKELDFRDFYSCNLSLRTDFLRRNGTFDEDFRHAAFEDIELGYRLQKRGLRIMYNPHAVGFHYRHVSFADARRRAEMIDLAYKTFEATEAGTYFKELKQREERALPRSAWSRQVLKSLFYKLAPLSSPFLSVLDSRFPLPGSVYHVLYRYHVDMRVQRRLQA